MTFRPRSKQLINGWGVGQVGQAGPAVNAIGHEPRRLFVLRGWVTPASGTVDVTVTIQVSNDGARWVDVLEFVTTLPGGTEVSGGIAEGDYIENPWPFVRARLDGITGTGTNPEVYVEMEEAYA